VARAVDVRIVALLCLVFYVGYVDGYSAFSFFRRLVDHVERREVCFAFSGEGLRYGRCERRLTVVYVANGSYVEVRFVPYIFLFCHVFLLPP